MLAKLLTATSIGTISALAVVFGIANAPTPAPQPTRSSPGGSCGTTS